MKKLILSFTLMLSFLLTACGGASTVHKDTTDNDTREVINAPMTDEETFAPITGAETEQKAEPGTETEEKTEGEVAPLKTFKNPLINQAAADPCILYHDGYYYGTYTEAVGISLFRSKTLENVFNDEKITVFRCCDQVQGNIWAPELFYNPSTDRWYIYSCGSFQGWDFFTIRMFCLESKTNDPFGEYEFKGFTDPDVLAIDQTMFFDEATDTLYTAYSEFTDAGQVIMVAMMENPWTISDKRLRVSYPRYNWEKRAFVTTKIPASMKARCFLSMKASCR